MHRTNPRGPAREPGDRQADERGPASQAGARPHDPDAVAVVGMALRVPGSEGPDAFWAHLAGGVESVTRFDAEELRAAGIPDSALADPHYVRAKPVLEDVAGFDARFFGLTPREAQVRDPQHRLFLESAYTALEHAGYDPFHVPGVVGVYGGGAPNLYREWNVAAHPEASAFLGEVGVMVANAADYLTTAVSHHLGLTGPSVNVATACSTSLVAVHTACRALRAGECDAAVAGGVQVELPRITGYHAAEGGMFSLTGRVRPFDADADGTIFGTGVGTVVLKRYADAVRDGDHVHAVIRASAINNDGNLKAGFTAPSVEGQARLIRRVMRESGIDPARVGYVEAHGTGTRVGDPIEVNALTRAYRDLGHTGVADIPLGSVKGNVGHLGPAAGVVGLIKAVLALGCGRIPPSINYRRPHPAIDFESGPFRVNTALSDWPAHHDVRLAAVSSFGVGGTNAHVVVEQPPPPPESRRPSSGRPALLTVSARTPAALAAATGRLADALEADPGQDLHDVAATLSHGRPHLRHRAAVVPGEDGAAKALRAAPADTAPAPADGAPVALLFPGQGSQHLGMGQRLYEQESVFREAVDECARLARPLLDADLTEVMFAADEPGAAARLTRTALAQPALFTVEYAMARLLASWGLRTGAMAGHSVGEYVAACLAGVFSPADALRLVVRRGALVQELPGGSMLAVPLAAEDLPRVEGADIAAYNGARLTVVSGPDAAVDAVQAALAERGVAGQRLHTSHAFHSAMMEPACEPFAAEVAKVQLHRPTLPFLSNVTGTWITDEQALDPAYWTRHLRAPVRFASAVALLLDDDELVFAEAGPGQVLTGLTRAQALAAGQRNRTVVPTMPSPQGTEEGPRRLARAVGTLWAAGAEIDWDAYRGGEWHRVPLPTYPFQRTEHWLDPGGKPATPAAADAQPPEPDEGRRPIERALFRPAWREESDPAPATASLARTWLVFRRGEGLDETVSALRRAGGQVVTVEPGESFGRLTGSRYLVRPGAREDYDALADALAADGLTPQRVLHGWLFGPPDETCRTDGVGGWLDLGFFSVLFLAQAYAERTTALAPGMRWDVAGSRLRAVTGAEPVEPARAAVTGVCDVLAKELPDIAVRCLDLAEQRHTAGLLEELARPGGTAPAFAACGDRWIALRGRRRWLLSYTSVPEPRVHGAAGPLRERGTYLITGGLGGIGLTVAEGLAKAVRARLVLTSRSAFPPREEWDEIAAASSATAASSDGDGERGAGTAPGVRETVRLLRRVEGYGAEVLVCRADVTDEPAMRAVVEQAQDAFGTLDGVFHTAGVPGGGLLALKSRAEAERVMAAKVRGTLVLDRLLGERVELMVLFSSITSVAGNLGQTDYAAANAFMDAYAHARAAEGPGFTVSVNWDAWAEIGMAAKADALAPAAFRALQAGDTTVEAGALAAAGGPVPAPGAAAGASASAEPVPVPGTVPAPGPTSAPGAGSASASAAALASASVPAAESGPVPEPRPGAAHGTVPLPGATSVPGSGPTPVPGAGSASASKVAPGVAPVPAAELRPGAAPGTVPVPGAAPDLGPFSAAGPGPTPDLGPTSAAGSGGQAGSGPQAGDPHGPGSGRESGTHPLLGRRVVTGSGGDARIAYRTVVDGESHWVSREHRVAGTPVWPATAYLEMARAAGAEALAGDPVAPVPLVLSDVTFLSVLTLTGPTTLRTALDPERDGYRFTIASRRDGEEEWTEHATGHVRGAPKSPAHVHDLEVLRECFPVVKPDTEPYEPEPGLIDFGPRWTNIAELRRDGSSALARIEMPEPYLAELADYPLHPALFDAATSNAVYLPELGPTGESYLPFTLSGVTLRGPLPPVVHVYTRRRGAHRTMVTFDLTLTDTEGREVVDVTGYTVRIWDPGAFRDSLATRVSTAPVPERTAAAVPAAEAPSVQALTGPQAGPSAGPPAGSGIGGAFAIRPEEGLRALWHILGDRLGPQIVVVPEGIGQRLRAVEALTQNVIAQAGQAPEHAGEAAAPTAGTAGGAARSEADGAPASTHARLAKLWSDALGIDDIGMDDDFFALGGNSLVGVQLAARVRREFDTELPIATLIENPTVRAIAGIITA
ncbi:SDR family NAD(P)-dependent oxidoreductase [Streptomyces tubbatahanensis]|uniref:SDR family NAD(P)-dependent oxidoreductase n=1 Tax=Streptomyces tubbatahanensis TaxID=2923272 RepID=A0ABY3Y0E2_9ACTN|nr:type I polyketide synthase [Streptomyces tubbatahanensis]UNT00220.1 SDR family NAD(P)-dependent oxidoreductase [Streptomyces tubbatahanensis]